MTHDRPGDGHEIDVPAKLHSPHLAHDGGRVLRHIPTGDLFAGLYDESDARPVHLVPIEPGDEGSILRNGAPASPASRARAIEALREPSECWEDVTERLRRDMAITGGRTLLSTEDCAALMPGTSVQLWRQNVWRGRVRAQKIEGRGRHGRLLIPWSEMDRYRVGALLVRARGRGGQVRTAAVAMVRDGQAPRDVGQALGVTERTVYRWLEQEGGERSRPASDRDTHAPAVLARYEAGERADAIADELDVPTTRVYAWIRWARARQQRGART